MLLLTADWLITCAGEVFPNGAVLVGEDGRIAQVGPRGVVSCPPNVRAEHYEGAALLPGLVNAHTHLELTGFDGQLADADFTDWILHLVELKRGKSPADFLEAARRGVQDCFAAGVTTVADTGDSGAVIQAMAEAGLAGIAYLEVFGPHPDDAPGNLAAYQERCARLSPFTAGRARLGVSPHAPYTVSGPLYRAAAEWARKQGLPIAVHIAESAAESDLMERGTGPFAERWAKRGIPALLPGRSPLAWLEEHAVLGPDILCIHAVRSGPDDLDRLRTYDCAVAHCPRSNRRHGHDDAPLSRFLAAGLRVGVGTDSVASLSPLDLMAEARAARALAGLDAAAALRLATIAAARALRLQAEVGSLEAGKQGDAAVLRCEPAGSAESALEAVLASGPEDVMATFSAGRAVFRRQSSIGIRPSAVR